MSRFWPKTGEAFTSPLLRSRQSSGAQLSASPSGEPSTGLASDLPVVTSTDKLDAAQDVLLQTDLRMNSNSSATSRQADGKHRYLAADAVSYVSHLLPAVYAAAICLASSQGRSKLLDYCMNLFVTNLVSFSLRSADSSPVHPPTVSLQQPQTPSNRGKQRHLRFQRTPQAWECSRYWPGSSGRHCTYRRAPFAPACKSPNII